MDIPRNIFISTAPRIAPILAQELAGLGFPHIEIQPKGVITKGNLYDCMKLNLNLRTANRVMLEFANFNAVSPDQLYDNAINLNWEDYIPSDGQLNVDAFVKTDTISDNRFANLKLKDAIVDRIKQKKGQRPDSGKDRSGTCVYMYWHENDCTLYFDTSGETLSKHNYRKTPGLAPMMESLAAAVVLTTRWDKKSPFINPMCGGGTLAIEAALIAANIPPGINRQNFAFMHLIPYQKDEWSNLIQEAKDDFTNNSPYIEASDFSIKAIASAKLNAREAGIEHMIKFNIQDFKKSLLPDDPGCLVINPEYGERLGDMEELRVVYKSIGDFFKQKCAGYYGYIFTGNRELAKEVGLKTKRKIEFYSGKIDCRLLEYELYGGSKKPNK